MINRKNAQQSSSTSNDSIGKHGDRSSVNANTDSSKSFDFNENNEIAKDVQLKKQSKDNSDVSLGSSNARSNEGNKWKFDVFVLLVLYALQGVPMGLSSTVDMLLRERGGIGYEAQAVYAMVTWPFSMKIIWAPIVDSHYFPGYGRRKSWLVPIQLLIALMLFVTPTYVDEFLKDNTHHTFEQVDNKYITHEVERILPLVIVFFTFYFLAATQDIVVDGWAVEMLPASHVSWASTCNSIGATFGYFTAFTGFLTMRSYQLIELKTFMYIWGFIYVIVTFLVALFIAEKQSFTSNSNSPEAQRVVNGDQKDSEKRNESHHSEIQNTGDTYVMMKKLVMSLPTVGTLIVLLLTCQIAFPGSESLTTRKLMKEKGLNSEHVAGLMLFITPLSMVLPGIISKKTADKPLKFYMDAYVPRLLLGIISAIIFYFTPQINSSEPLPWHIFLVFFILSIFQSVIGTIHYVSLMAFFAKVSDPQIGGTYMTLLNTMVNLGNIFPKQLVLFLVNRLTWKYCIFSGLDEQSSKNYLECVHPDMQAMCEKQGGTCETQIDGYYVLVFLSFLFGIAWYKFFSPRAEWLESQPEKEWRLRND